MIAEDGRDAQGSRAGLVTRGIADIVDVVVVALTLVGGYFAYCAVVFMLRPRTFTFPEPGRYWSILIGALVVIGYLTFSWHISGRTPGKQLAGLRVVTDRGRPLSFHTALTRALLYVLFPIGLFWSAFSARNASLQDLLLRTSVVYDWRKRTADAPVVITPLETESRWARAP